MTKKAILSQEPRYCLFEELYPAFIQLLTEIHKEGYTEKRRVQAFQLSKLLFSSKTDSFILVIDELFSESIVHVTNLDEKLGVHKGTVLRYLNELKRFQVVSKTPITTLPVTPGNQSRLVFYHLHSIENDHLIKYIENHWPEMIRKYEDISVNEGSMKKILKCTKCGREFKNGSKYCNTCTESSFQKLVRDENGRAVCPRCDHDYGRSSANYCNQCVDTQPVKLVEVAVDA